jgi:hypothetical protein
VTTFTTCKPELHNSVFVFFVITNVIFAYRPTGPSRTLRGTLTAVWEPLLYRNYLRNYTTIHERKFHIF